MIPESFRVDHAALTIHFSIGQCWLGDILVAQSDQGICAISLGDDRRALTHGLRVSFPKATLIDSQIESVDLLTHILAWVETPRNEFKLPLDLHGTPFQRQVWQALQKIPPNQTTSYSKIANQIGMPQAVRAVAGACAANKLAVAIPCHRVVRANGHVSGYRWGVERKRALLMREGFAC